MGGRIVRSKSADYDLLEIWNYLAEQASPSIADFVIARLCEAMNRAAEHPLMYRRTEYRGRPRRVNVFEYAIFYEPLPNGEGVRVRRHSRTPQYRKVDRRRELDRRALNSDLGALAPAADLELRQGRGHRAQPLKA